MLDATALEALIAGGETQMVECKVAPPRLGEIANKLCGFANSLGGYLIIGVADQTWEVIGLKRPQDAIDVLLQAARNCTPPIRFSPAHPQQVTLQGKQVVLAHIPANEGQLYQASGVCWTRRGTHTVPMDVAEIEAFLHRRGSLAWESQPLVRATLADLNMEVVEAYLAQRPSHHRNADRLPPPEEFLLNLGCATLVKDGSTSIPCPTNAGMLLFGKHPQDFLVQAEVICLLYKDPLGMQRYADRRILHGTIPEQIDQAAAFLAQYIPVSARIEGFHRIDEPDYPLEALREGVVNAIIHRDYSLLGEAVRLMYYPERIEIRNPGLLMPGIRLEDLRQGKARSKPRNPMMASILRDLPGGYMEKIGSGIRFMVEEMRRLGRTDPEFREQGEFVVTFRKSPLPAESGMMNIDQPTPVKEPLTPASSGKAEGQAEHQRTREERQQLALQHVQQHGSITSGVYRQMTGVGENTATRDLEALVERGALRAFGEKRARYYTR